MKNLLRFVFVYMHSFGQILPSYLSVILMHSVAKAKDRDDAFRGARWNLDRI